MSPDLQSIPQELKDRPEPAPSLDREALTAAALDLEKITLVLKARLQLVGPPPVIFLRRRPTIKTTVEQSLEAL